MTTTVTVSAPVVVETTAVRMFEWYCVDATNGNDANGGSTADPWQTVGKVNGATFDMADCVMFKKGETWQATPASPNGAALLGSSSGARGLPITYDAYGTGADPIFDNCVIYTDWAVYDDPTYRRAEVSDGELGRQVFENGVRLIKTTSIANVKATAGSWYYESGFAYVHTTTGATPNGLNVGYPADGGHPWGFEANGYSWLTLRNLDIRRCKASGYYIGDGANGIVTEDCTASWTGQRGWRFTCYTHDGAHEPTDCRISRCVAHDTASEGIWVSGIGTIVEDCEVYDTKKDWTSKNIGSSADGCGILAGIYSNGVIVRRNYIHDGYSNAVLMLEYEGAYGEGARPTGCIFERNNIVDNQARTDGGSPISLQGDATCIIRNNIVDMTATGSGSSNINISNGAINVKVYNNTIIKRVAGAWGIGISGSATATIKNNILRNIAANSAILISAGSEATVLGNNLYSGGAGGTGFYGQIAANTYNTANFANFETAASETGGVLDNPDFVDEASDYHLQSGSACRNAGEDGLVTDDYDGVTRAAYDIGALEYVA